MVLVQVFILREIINYFNNIWKNILGNPSFSFFKIKYLEINSALNLNKVLRNKIINWYMPEYGVTNPAMFGRGW